MPVDESGQIGRRRFLATGLVGAGLLGTGTSWSSARADDKASVAPIPLGKAEHCIFLWLGGGMAQIDTFDPKEPGDAKAKPKKAGSYYGSIDTAVPGVRVCEHLERTARVVDRMTILRTINHKVVDEHAFATNLVHTGRMISGNAVYPSLGSAVAYTKGAVNSSVPAYMLIGYPNPARGPGFLGAKYGPISLVDTNEGPKGFSRPPHVSDKRAAARERLLEPLRQSARGNVAEYASAQRDAIRLAGPEFLRHFEIDKEPASLRERYGGEFGRRCLLARRLVQGGVRFIEVSHNLNFLNGTGWDTHNEGQINQHLLIRELDAALATLIEDLDEQGILDKTLVVLGTEFGRPAEFDGRGGRGHQGSTFSLLVAGGGLRHRGAYGVTDELSKKIVESPVSLADFHATIHAALGTDPATELRDGARPVPLTDGGQPVSALFG